MCTLPACINRRCEHVRTRYYQGARSHGITSLRLLLPPPLILQQHCSNLDRKLLPQSSIVAFVLLSITASRLCQSSSSPRLPKHSKGNHTLAKHCLKTMNSQLPHLLLSAIPCPSVCKINLIPLILLCMPPPVPPSLFAVLSAQPRDLHVGGRQ